MQSDQKLGLQKNSKNRHSYLFDIKGIWCPSCAVTIEKSFAQNPLFSRIKFDYNKQALFLESESPINSADVEQKINSLGYELYKYKNVNEKIESEAAQLKTQALRLTVTSFSFVWTMIFAAVTYFEPGGPLSNSEHSLINTLMFATAFPAVAMAWPLFRVAYASLKTRDINIDVLVAMGVLSCIALSLLSYFDSETKNYLDSVVAILFFITLIRFVERKAIWSKFLSHSLSLSERLKPVKVLSPSEKIKIKKLCQIKIGQILVFESGEEILVDGEVLSGQATVNTSVISGEEVNISVRKGMAVLAGSYLQNGKIKVRVNSDFGKRLKDVSYSTELNVKSHKEQRAFDYKIIKAAPLILLIVSFFTLIYRFYFLNELWHESLSVSISVVIVFCPCVLYINRPMVLLNSALRLNKSGIKLLRFESILEMCSIKNLVFDKTGTLTGQNGSITVIEKKTPHRLDEIWSLILAMEVNVFHPVSVAVQKKSYEKNVIPCDIESKRVYQNGISCVWSNKIWKFGSVEFTQTREIKTSHLNLVSNENDFVSFEFKQSKNDDLLDLWTEAKQLKKSTYILTGDNIVSSNKFLYLHNLKPDEIKSNLKPSDKSREVKKLVPKGGVFFIGDGYNDLEAQKYSTVSASLPNSTAEFIKNSDMIITKLDGKVLNQLQIESLKVKKRIAQNWVFAGLYNATAVFLTLWIGLTPGVAAFSMSVSSGLILVNAFRS